MKRFTKRLSAVLTLTGALALAGVLGLSSNAVGGPTLSASYDIFPYQDFDDPLIDSISGTDTTFIKDPQAQLQKLRATFTYPLVFGQGKTVLVNIVSYQLIDFNYHVINPEVKRLQSVAYTLMLQQKLNEKWSMWALATPTLASDLRAEISEKDFNFQAAAIFIRQFSPKFSLGLGGAFTNQFGKGTVVPIVALDWNNGKNLSAKAILPASLEFWYRTGPKLDLGLLVSGDGNNFRGDTRIYQVPDPQLRYTMLTVGPAARLKIQKYVTLNAEAGIIGLHRIEFYDDNTKKESYDLKPKQYARVGLTLGM